MIQAPVHAPSDALNGEEALAPDPGIAYSARLLAAYGWAVLPLGLGADSGFTLDAPG